MQGVLEVLEVRVPLGLVVLKVRALVVPRLVPSGASQHFQQRLHPQPRQVTV